MNSLVVSGCLLAVCAGTGAANAVPALAGSARLELQDETGTRQCLDARALERAVDSRLGQRAFRVDVPATLYVKVVLAKNPQVGWSAQITVRDGTGAPLGARSIASQAPHCSSLDDSLALVIALLVADPPSPPPAGSAPADLAGAAPLRSGNVERRPIVLPPDTYAPREPWRVGVRLAGAISVGSVPGVARGVEGGIELRPPRGPAFELFATTFVARHVHRSEDAAGAAFSSTALGLELCPLGDDVGALRWSVCAGQAVGWLKVDSFGFDVNTSVSHLSYDLVGHTYLDWSLTRTLALRFGARAEIPLVRDVFSYGARDGSEPTLYEVSPIAAVLDLGFLARW